MCKGQEDMIIATKQDIVTPPTFFSPRKRVPGSSPNLLSIAASYSAGKSKPLIKTQQPQQEESGVGSLMLKSNTFPCGVLQ